jgi:isoleucyl-tRNA synthetase
LYADIDGWKPKEFKAPVGLLDKWIVSELHVLIKEYNRCMEAYELNHAVRLLPKFIDNLSNWYIRRSRKRFWKSEDDGDKEEAYQTLHYVLVELAKLMAPFAPFMAEEIFKNLTGKESVHLEDMPVVDESMIDEKLNGKMEIIRGVVNTGLSLRSQHKIKVRQPLSFIRINTEKYGDALIDNSYATSIIQEELNVHGIEFGTKVGDVELNTEITEDLKLEGYAREIIRGIQEMRKEAGYEIDNRIKVGYTGTLAVFEKFGPLIAKETLATELSASSLTEFDLEKQINIDEIQLNIQIRRIA